MKVKFRQSGGYAGLIRETDEIDTDAAPEEERKKLRTLVEQSGILQTQGRRSDKGADLQQYEITIQNSQGDIHRVAFDDMTLPERAAPLVEYLMERTRPA